MSKRLVFLHIPKSSGSSQRTLLFDLYTRPGVFWYGLDTDPEISTFDYQKIDGCKVLGGHKKLSFYPQDIDALYCSLIRDPVKRVVSLFSYYAKPHYAENTLSDARRKVNKLWLSRGIDPDSIVNSLNNCSEFRDEVLNFQCRFLSRYNATFDDVKKTLAEMDHVVGSMESSAAFNDHLSGLLNWGQVPIRKKNRSKSDSHSKILSEPGAEKLILSLVKEDIKLFNYIENENNGLVFNANSVGSVKEALSSNNAYINGVTPRFLTEISTYCKGFVFLNEQGAGTTGVCFVNHSEYDIGDDYIPGVGVHCDYYDVDGQRVGESGQKIVLDKVVLPGGSYEFTVNFDVDKLLIERVKYVDISLYVSGVKGLNKVNLFHKARALVMRKT